MPIKLKRFLLKGVEVALVLGFIDFAIGILGPFLFPEYIALIQWSWRGIMLLICAGMTWHLYKRCESGEIFFDDRRWH
jgi:hypothetical protein